MTAADRPPSFASLLSLPLQLANLAVVLLGVGGFLALRPHLPDRIVMHTTLGGTPTRTGSPDELWALFAMLPVLWGFLLLVAYVIATERRTPPAGPEIAALDRQRKAGIVRLAEWTFLVIDLALVVVGLSFAGAGLPGREGLRTAGAIGGTTLAIGGAAVVLVAFVPRLRRIDRALEARGVNPAPGTRPSGWRCGGLIYWAPSDPAVFVPKRWGVGLTVNFARPGAWAFLAAVLVIPLAILLAVALAT